MDRRDFVMSATAAMGYAACPWPTLTATSRGATMYGLIGKITTLAGQRDALAAILLQGTGNMPGCLSYIIASDSSDPEGLWITEVWESAEHHQASLSLPQVQDAITKGRPLIAGFSNRTETVPLGGQGLNAAGRR